MFDYTKAALFEVVEDFKKIITGINITTQALTIVYLIYTLIANTGVMIANAILLALSIAYFIYFLMSSRKEKKKLTKQEKARKKNIKNIYQWCKRIVKLLPIGVAIYGLFITNLDFTPLSLLLVLLMILGWIFEFLCHLIKNYLTAKVEFIIAGITADIEPITKIVNTVNKWRGKEVEEPAPPDKNRLKLDQMVAQQKEQKAQEKKQKKLEKKQQKLAKKQRLLAEETAVAETETDIQPDPSPTKTEKLKTILNAFKKK